MSSVVHVTDQTFQQEVLESDLPVMLDLWAEWCGPCRMIAPILEQLAKEYNGKIKIAKLDVDSNQMVAAQLGIRGIPTLVIFKDGQEIKRQVGAGPKQIYVRMIEEVLEN